ncbi:hypothetical protein C8F01DRAFT_1255306 [Mycena amicta]|nr:hypothetical protein C8F01DRAFT_1255306 [Mycena amicta]
MAPSTNKSSVGVVGVHLAPPDVDQQTFLSNVEKLWDSILALPASKCFLKVDILSPNEHFASELQLKMRFGKPPPCAILRVECESTESFRKFLADPDIQRIIASGRSFGYHHDVNGFTADIHTYIDELQPGAASANAILMFKLPSANAMGLTRSTQLSGSPLCEAKYHQFQSNTAAAEDIKLLDFPEAQSTVVVFIEAQEMKNFKEIVDDPASTELILNQIHEGGLPSFETYGFFADAISKKGHM